MFDVSFPKALALVIGGLLFIGCLVTTIWLSVLALVDHAAGKFGLFIILAAFGVFAGYRLMHWAEKRFWKAWDIFFDIIITSY